ncbi:hypothetical protein LH464_12345 [Neorhizobium sp. T786]|uniref:hypothetical protein n=1 Tax=Pseudorhizobium xiangyangii TaxID=2883104 RepID=UPI001CFFAF45|nr:hypothetical protein [Neorhizobium xiangyangii]MCB5203260.1 hypothetical protein [Neorhizobium xiangyangii]
MAELFGKVLVYSLNCDHPEHDREAYAKKRFSSPEGDEWAMREPTTVAECRRFARLDGWQIKNGRAICSMCRTPPPQTNVQAADIDQRALAVADDIVRQMMDKGALLAVRDNDDEMVPMALDRQFQLKAGWQVAIAAAIEAPPTPDLHVEPVAYLRHGEEAPVRQVPWGAMWISDKDDPRAFPVFATPPVQHAAGEQIDYPKILYVCEICAENNAEACGNDRGRINVTPDGRWLCDDCRDGEGVDVGECRDAPKLYTAPATNVPCRDCDGYTCDDGCAYPDPSPSPTTASTNAWHTACVNILWTSGETYKLFYKIKELAEAIERGEVYPATETKSERTDHG